jgi:hypothetical protein
VWSGVVRIHLLEEVEIDHNSAIDRQPFGVAVVHVKCFTLTMDKANTIQGDELSTVLNNVSLDLFFVLVILERESSKGVDAPCPLEFLNGEVDRGFAKCGAIKVEIPTCYTEILLP